MVYAIGLSGSGGFGGRGPGGPGGGHGGGGGRGGHGGFGGPGGRYPGNFSPQFGGWSVGGQPPHGGTANDGPDPGLTKIADATGGGFFHLTTTDDLTRTFKRVADELHHQYLLGFTPSKLDGKTHHLEVKVSDATYTVRARKTYLAPSDH